jgi:putative peptide zinc metalloprotease protein
MIPLGLMAAEHQILLLFHVIWLLNLMMLMTLNPVFKMDGYWLLSDLSGLRNLHQRMEETLVGAVWKLRGKAVAPSMQQTVTGARRKILYAYTGLALVYYLYLLPLLFRAIVGVVLRYPARAYDSLAIVGGLLRSGEPTQALFAVGHFIHISIWPVLLGVFLMRFVLKLVRGLVARIGEGIRCLVRGLCTCEPAPSDQAAVPASQVEESRSSSVSG